MNDGTRRYSGDVPNDLTARVRQLCVALPDILEQTAWVGTRWVVRKRTFAHVLVVEVADAAPVVVLAFRAADEDFEMLRHAGHPFFGLGWGRNALGMVIDAATDWDEVSELVVDSYCALAPKKLVALVDRPGEDKSWGPKT